MMKRKIICFLAIMLPLWCTAQLTDGQIRDLCQEAEKCFREAVELPSSEYARAQELYGQSARRYEKVLAESSHRNGKLYYNLGNVYMRLDELGLAILNYRRAQQLLPNDENLLRNLAYARLQCRDSFEVPEQEKVLKTIFFWHYDFSPSLRQILFLGIYLLFWLAMLTGLWCRRGWLRLATLLLLLPLLALLASLGLDWRQRKLDNPGVIVSKEVVARQGDATTYAEAFQEPLHAGTEFTLVQRRQDWAEIRLPGGQTCWIPGNSLMTVN